MQVKALQVGRIKLFWRYGFSEDDRREADALGYSRLCGFRFLKGFSGLIGPYVLFLLFVGQHCSGSHG